MAAQGMTESVQYVTSMKAAPSQVQVSQAWCRGSCTMGSATPPRPPWGEAAQLMKCPKPPGKLGKPSSKAQIF